MFSENSKKVICLDAFSKQIYIIWIIFRLISVFETTALLNLPKYSIFLWLLLPDLIGSQIWMSIMKTSPCNEHPLTPHFYIEKLGCTGVYIFFLFLLKNIDCWYSVEPPQSLRRF